LLVVLLVCAPLGFVVEQASTAGGALDVLTRPALRTLMVHTVLLSVGVTSLCVVVGFAAAYFVERTALPFPRVWTILLAMPLAVPEYVHSYSWVSLAPSVRGYWGAVLVMSTSLYPLVFLPCLASLRRTDGALEEVARSLGSRAWGTALRVTLPSCRSAVTGGALLVSLYLLGEHGAFASLRYQTFATAIYNDYKLGFDGASAAVLSLVLCGLALLVVGVDLKATGTAPTARRGELSRRPTRTALGRSIAAALALLGLQTS
jgi:iron(III) transport system permease protein